MNQFLCLFLLLLSGFSAYSQRSEETDTTKAKTTFTIATLYSNNIDYYGQTSAGRLPYVLGYAALRFPTGLWISGQSFKLLNSQSGIGGITASAGYDFELSKNLSGSLSYGRSFYPDNSQLLQSVNEDIASASLIYDWQWFSTALNADYAPGQEDVLYTSFRASKIIDPGVSISSKDYFTIEPVFEIVAGTQRFSDTTWTSSGGAPERPTDILDKPLKNKGRNRGKVTDFLPGQAPDRATVVSTSPFDLLSYSFTIPLVYNRAKYAVEASYQGTVLSRAVTDSQKLRSFFNLGFYYTF